MLKRLSRMIHDAIYEDCSESLCSHAWRYQDEYRFWKLWVLVFGRKHCEASYWHHNDADHQ